MRHRKREPAMEVMKAGIISPKRKPRRNRLRIAKEATPILSDPDLIFKLSTFSPKQEVTERVEMPLGSSDTWN